MRDDADGRERVFVGSPRESSLLIRRHAGNMTRGKSIVELNGLRVFKKALDRQRGK